MDLVRICEIPTCRMVSSGIGKLGSPKFRRFEEWFRRFPQPLCPHDYLYWEGEWPEIGGFHWLYLHEDGMEVPEEFRVVDFRGGLYAVVTGTETELSHAEELATISRFARLNHLLLDRSRPELLNIITPPVAAAVMNFRQMDYYVPVKPVEKYRE